MGKSKLVAMYVVCTCTCAPGDGEGMEVHTVQECTDS